jgi:hypothetical protein
MVSAYLCLLQKCVLAGGSSCQVRLLRSIPLLLMLLLLPLVLLLLLLLLRLLLLLLVLLGQVAPHSICCRVARQNRHRLGGALPDTPVSHRPPALVRPLLRRRLLLARRAARCLVALRGCGRRRLRPRCENRRPADGAVLLPLQPRPEHTSTTQFLSALNRWSIMPRGS